jgi:hypothetical protein
MAGDQEDGRKANDFVIAQALAFEFGRDQSREQVRARLRAPSPYVLREIVMKLPREQERLVSR